MGTEKLEPLAQKRSEITLSKGHCEIKLLGGETVSLHQRDAVVYSKESGRGLSFGPFEYSCDVGISWPGRDGVDLTIIEHPAFWIISWRSGEIDSENWQRLKGPKGVLVRALGSLQGVSFPEKVGGPIVNYEEGQLREQYRYFYRCLVDLVSAPAL